MVVRISGDGSISGLTDWEATSVTHPESADTNIALAGDGSVAFDSIPADIQAAIDNAGKVVAVKHVLKTDTFSASVAESANVAVDDLEIVHEVADAANRLIITAYFGMAASTGGQGDVGIGIDDGSGLIAIADADGVRTRTTAGGRVAASSSNLVVAMPSVTFVHTPGTGSKTYTVRAINLRTGTRTLYINRSEDDSNFVDRSRATSALVIQEVRP